MVQCTAETYCTILYVNIINHQLYLYVCEHVLYWKYYDDAACCSLKLGAAAPQCEMFSMSISACIILSDKDR